jgi:hypothetical protein
MYASGGLHLSNVPEHLLTLQSGYICLHSMLVFADGVAMHRRSRRRRRTSVDSQVLLQGWNQIGGDPSIDEGLLEVS